MDKRKERAKSEDKKKDSWEHSLPEADRRPNPLQESYRAYRGSEKGGKSSHYTGLVGVDWIEDVQLHFILTGLWKAIQRTIYAPGMR